MLVSQLFLLDLLVLTVNAGSIIAGLQTVPPNVRYGVNRDAFDKSLLGKFFLKKTITY